MLLDEHEAQDKAVTLRWVRSGAPLFRIAMRIEADPREANEVRWFALDDPAEWAHDRFDPHMARFRDKLLARLGTRVLAG